MKKTAVLLSVCLILCSLMTGALAKTYNTAADGLYNLARSCLSGNGSKDWNRAARLFEQAAEQGSVQAMAMISSIYHYGVSSSSIAKNEALAEYWHKKAVAAGYTGKQYDPLLLLSGGDMGSKKVLSPRKILSWAIEISLFLLAGAVGKTFWNKRKEK